jgi:hypothetical protein
MHRVAMTMPLCSACRLGLFCVDEICRRSTHSRLIRQALKEELEAMRNLARLVKEREELRAQRPALVRVCGCVSACECKCQQTSVADATI